MVRLGGGVSFLDNVRRSPVDIVFNIAEGRGSYRSREAQVPAVLEMLGIPYTGSDPLALAIGLDKPLTKRLAATDGVRTPGWCVVGSTVELSEEPWQGLKFPLIIKPAYEGSSKGIRLTSLAGSAREVEAKARRILEDYRQPVMVEEFIDGDEVTVGMVGNAPPRVVGIMRVLPRKPTEHFIYSLEVKKDYVNLVDYECPAQLAEGVLREIEVFSLKVFRLLGCRDFSRLDFRVGPDGRAYFLEINPLPGLGSYSDLVIMALKVGWTYEGLINAVLEAAVGRYPQCAGRLP
ncbi:MAG: D-alanine--D-alanine ligase [Dehalococcoidales bacterium]|nr:D-alanine--D-alanine ligase [Dehalococcoidales bacterium]